MTEAGESPTPVRPTVEESSDDRRNDQQLAQHIAANTAAMLSVVDALRNRTDSDPLVSPDNFKKGKGKGKNKKCNQCKQCKHGKRRDGHGQCSENCTPPSINITINNGGGGGGGACNTPSPVVTPKTTEEAPETTPETISEAAQEEVQGEVQPTTS